MTCPRFEDGHHYRGPFLTAESPHTRFCVCGATETEPQIIAHYTKCRDAHGAAAKVLDDHFMPLMREAVAKGDRAEMDAIIDRCPSSVTKAFLLDARREALK